MKTNKVKRVTVVKILGFLMLLNNWGLCAQEIFISNLSIFDAQKIKNDEYIFTGFKSWYKSACVINPEVVCKQITSGGARLRIENVQNFIQEKLLINNRAGYKMPDFDSLIYNISYRDLNESFLIRKLYFTNVYQKASPFVVDTFRLKVVDTLYFNQRRLIKRIFKKNYKKGLKIFVLSSSSVNKEDTLHFWVDGIGVIKVVYRDCWAYSFELNFENRLSKGMNLLFEKLLILIKQKYKDPEWLDAPCNISSNKNPNN